jgi:hypothetical protein
MRAVRRRANYAGDFGSEHERRIRPVLVEAPGEQRVRERRTGRMHVDHHAVARGFVDLGQLDRVWTI